MMTIKAHFYGKVIVPDEPVNLLPGQSLVVRLDEGEPAGAAGTAAAAARRLRCSEAHRLP